MNCIESAQSNHESDYDAAIPLVAKYYILLLHDGTVFFEIDSHRLKLLSFSLYAYHALNIRI